MPTTWYATNSFPQLPPQIACDGCGQSANIVGVGHDEENRDSVLYLIRCQSCGPRHVSAVAPERGLSFD